MKKVLMVFALLGVLFLSGCNTKDDYDKLYPNYDCIDCNGTQVCSPMPEIINCSEILLRQKLRLAEENECNMINTLRGCEYYFTSRNYTLNLKERVFWDENSMLVNSSYRIKDDYKLICEELNSTNLICEPKYITYKRHLYEGKLIIGDKTTKVLYVNDSLYPKSDLLQCEYRERQFWKEGYQIYNNNTKRLTFCEFCNIRCYN